MAGYSGTPLAKMLGFKEGSRCAFVSAPSDFARLLAPFPEDISILSSPRAGMDLIVLFVRSAADLKLQFGKYSKLLAASGMLWIAWPKKTSGVASDLTEDVVRRIGLGAGLVDVKVCAIDETWSGLKFVIRLKDRPKPRKASTGKRGSS